MEAVDGAAYLIVQVNRFSSAVQTHLERFPRMALTEDRSVLSESRREMGLTREARQLLQVDVNKSEPVSTGNMAY